MAVGDEWTIDALNKRIYSSGPSTFTVNELYSWLMDQFDNQEYMDDPIPMTAQTPTEYTLVNGWFIDEESLKFLKGGAIKTSGWTNEIYILTFQESGYTDCVSSDIGKFVNTGGTDFGTLLFYNNTKRKWWIRIKEGQSVPSPGSTVSVTDGTGSGTLESSATGEDLYANIYTLGTIESGTNIYVIQAGERYPAYWGINNSSEWWPAGHIDILIRVKEADTEVDEGKVTIYAREYTDYYDFYEIDLSAGGRNAVPLATSDDLDNQTAGSTVANYIEDIKIWFVHGTLPYDSGSGSFPTGGIVGHVIYDSTSDGVGVVVEQVAGDETAGTFRLANVSGNFADNDSLMILSELTFGSPSGTFHVGDTVTGETSGASGVIRYLEQIQGGTIGYLYLSDRNANDFQDGENLLVNGNTIAVAVGTQTDYNWSGSVNGSFTFGNTIDKDIDDGQGAQPYNVVIDLGGKTVAELYEFVKYICRRGSNYILKPTDGTSTIYSVPGEQYQKAVTTYTQVKKASPLGTFAGGKFFGARGIWIQNMDVNDIRNYQLIDANNVTHDPPNWQAFVVTNLQAGDRVAIFPTVAQGSTTINKSQFTLAGQSSGVDYIEVQEEIPVDTPYKEEDMPGVIRVRYNVGQPNEGEDIYQYDSIDFANKRFHLTTTTVRAYTSSDKAYVPYMDRTASSSEESVTVKYVTDRYVVVIVRRKGIIPFQLAATFTDTGLRVSAIRTTDSIVT